VQTDGPFAERRSKQGAIGLDATAKKQGALRDEGTHLLRRDNHARHDLLRLLIGLVIERHIHLPPARFHHRTNSAMPLRHQRH
jgi:hypothetical protein